MADFDVAYNWMMDNEDAPRTYKTVPDCGGQAISGINSESFPEEFAAINSIAQHERGVAVEQFYERHFWNEWFDHLASDDVAKHVFDFAVNAGSVAAIKTLQRAVLQCDPDASLDVDGVWGPHTIMRVNLEDSERMVIAFCAHRVDYYKAIVTANPAKAKYLSGWIARAEK